MVVIQEINEIGYGNKSFPSSFQTTIDYPDAPEAPYVVGQVSAAVVSIQLCVSLTYLY